MKTARAIYRVVNAPTELNRVPWSHLYRLIEGIEGVDSVPVLDEMGICFVVPFSPELVPLFRSGLLCELVHNL